MTKVSESYIVGFDLNDTGEDLSAASICQFDPEKGRYNIIRTLYGEEAELLHDHICSDQAMRINMVPNNGRLAAMQLISEIYSPKK